MKWLWVSLVVLVIDQSTKLLADGILQLYESIPVMPMLAITKVYNTGAAFSFLAGADGWQRWFFVVLTLGVSIFLLGWLRKTGPGEQRTAFALALILGGAIGNLVDRLVYGHVVDFIDVYYGSWHFPTFNVADSAISVGAALLILDAVLQQRRATTG